MSPPKRSERPLVVRCGAFGDMVLVTALIEELSRSFGSEVDILTSGSWSEPLLRGQSGVGDIMTVRSRKTPYWLSIDQHRAVRRLRARGAGPTWFCDGNDAARPMLTRAGIDASDIVELKDHPLLAGEHATQQWRRMAHIMPGRMTLARTDAARAQGGDLATAREAGILTSPGGCRLVVSDQQRMELEHWLPSRGVPDAPLIAIQMGNKRTMRRGLRRLAVNNKHWPMDRWAAVVRHLRQRHPGHAIVLLGTGPEYQLNEELAALAGTDGLHNLADDLPVPRLVALLAQAEGLITVDSGPAHAAAAVGCPQVTLFGKASTSLYRPWGVSGADVKVLTGTVDGQANMLGITPAAVIAAWDALVLRNSKAD
jgi:ADP-heptose:LPS heptosyltransferase